MKFVIAFFLSIIFCSCQVLSDCVNGTEVVLSISTTNTSNTIVNGCLAIGDDHFQCGSLSSALDVLQSSSDTCVSFTIELNYTDTAHYITHPITANVSVHITTIDKKPALVVCDYDVDVYHKETAGKHTLYFNEAPSVAFTNVDFENCPLPFSIYKADNVTIRGSSFRYFKEAVYDIHNCLTVTVDNCTFAHNFGSGISFESFRGNTGGLSITYNNFDSRLHLNPTVIVGNSMFINNTAVASKTFNTDQIFTSGILTGRGGGMAVFVLEDVFGVSVKIHDCYYYGNEVSSYGGGCYVLLRGAGGHSAVLEDNLYDSNMAALGGSGVILVGVDVSGAMFHSYAVKRCMFRNNIGNIGAALYYFITFGGGRSNILSIEDCYFVKNSFLVDRSESFGAAIAVDFEENHGQKGSTVTNRINNCSFVDNTGASSIVSIVFYPFEFTGTNRFVNNSGTALRLVGVAVTLSDRVEFVGNSAIDGSALQLLSFSQLRLSDNLQLIFDSNVGRFGSSLSASGIPVITTFQRLFYNPKCFLLLRSQPDLSPLHWHTVGVNITFTRNWAWFGSAIFATSLTSCSWISTDIDNAFDLQYFLHWPVFNIKDDNYNGAFSDPFDQSYSVATDPISLETFNKTAVSEWPGQTLTFPLQSFDEMGNPAGSITGLQFISSNDSNHLPSVKLTPNTVLIGSDSFSMSLSYLINQETSNLEADVNGFITFSSSGVLLLSKDSASTSVSFNGTNCIGGYTLVDFGGDFGQKICQCDSTERNIISCEPDQDSLIIKPGLWASYDDRSLFFHLCPYGYCRCFLNTTLGNTSCEQVFTNSNPNRQCVCGRKGTLCGECVDGTGVSVLLNICSQCDTANIALIPILIVVIAVIMVVIILADKPLPEWTFPILFYMQIAPIASLHFPLSFITIGKYITFIGSALSLYFPYDFCVHNGMQAIEAFGLKYIPAITAISVICPTFLIRRFVRKYCSPRFHLRSLKGHGVWTIILMTYTITLYTSTTLLNCPNLPDRNGTMTPRWYVDGSVECFKGNHIPLALFALMWVIFLVFLIPVPFLLVYKTQLRCDHPISRRLECFVTEHFRKGFEFWYAIELFRRLLIIVILTASPSNSSLVLLSVMVLVLLYGYWMPYKTKYANYLEIGLLIVIQILLNSRINPFLQDVLGSTVPTGATSIPSCTGSNVTVTRLSLILLLIYYVPVLVGVICLLIWITGHVWKRIHCKIPIRPRRTHKGSTTTELPATNYYLHNGSGKYRVTSTTFAFADDDFNVL